MSSTWAVEPVSDFVSVHRIGSWPFRLPPRDSGVEGIVFYGPAVLDRSKCPAERGWAVCPDFWKRGPCARVSCEQGTLYVLPQWGDAWPLDTDCKAEPWLTLPVGYEDKPCQN